MTAELALLQSFSRGLLALGDATRSAPPARMLHDGLQVLRPLVSFRSAWWGECSDSAPEGPPRNWLHGRINLSPSFAQEWNRLSGDDGFARDSMRQLDTVVRISGYDDPVLGVEQFARKHQLFHIMALTTEMPGSGLLFFVALYRGEDGPAFDERDSVVFHEFTRHLAQRWQRRVQDMLRQAATRDSDAFALADARGELLYLGKRLGTLLHQAYPGWDGSLLPPQIAAALAHGTGALALVGQQLLLQRCGELLALSLERKRRTGLPPRERSAAMLYAQGQSYKAIARLLDLSPATVRTYLRSAYLQLGVRNKVELGSALRTLPQR
jgi:DNA-binding CsgD family transcriptional regulator